jgi:hypothetical protein
VFASSDSGFKMQRSEQWRASHKHDLCVGLHEWLVAGSAAKAAFRRHIELFAGLQGPLLEVIRNGNNLDIETEDFAGFKRFLGCAAATAAAADQTDLKELV